MERQRIREADVGLRVRIGRIGRVGRIGPIAA